MKSISYISLFFILTNTYKRINYKRRNNLSGLTPYKIGYTISLEQRIPKKEQENLSMAEKAVLKKLVKSLKEETARRR